MAIINVWRKIRMDITSYLLVFAWRKARSRHTQTKKPCDLSIDKGKETCEDKVGEFLLYSFSYCFDFFQLLDCMTIENDTVPKL